MPNSPDSVADLHNLVFSHENTSLRSGATSSDSRGFIYPKSAATIPGTTLQDPHARPLDTLASHHPNTAPLTSFVPHSASSDLQHFQNLQNLQNLQNMHHTNLNNKTSLHSQISRAGAEKPRDKAEVYLTPNTPILSAMKHVNKLINDAYANPDSNLKYITVRGIGKAMDRAVIVAVRLQQQGLKVSFHSGTVSIVDEQGHFLEAKRVQSIEVRVYLGPKP